MAEAAVQAGAQMIFLPEYCGGLATESGALRLPVAPEQTHAFLIAFRDFARRAGVWVNIGSLAIAGSKGKTINRGYMIDDLGNIVGHYDKIHLFDVNLGEGENYRESTTIEAGTSARLYNTPFGRIGHTICYDLRFPALFRDLAQAGAEIICCPAAFTRTTGEPHWHVLNRARAIENTCFVVSTCAVGPIEGGGESFGHSLVVSPWGEILADADLLPGVLHAQLELDRVAETADRLPSLKHDRDYDVHVMSERSFA